MNVIVSLLITRLYHLDMDDVILQHWTPKGLIRLNSFFLSPFFTQGNGDIFFLLFLLLLLLFNVDFF